MNKFVRFLRLYFVSFYTLPIIPKVIVEIDGFVLNDKKVLLSEIICIMYRNSYSPNNTIGPFVGYSHYEVLTKNNTLYFLGEHDDLAALLDKHLDIETQFEDKYIGYVKRWKMAGGKYQFISLNDMNVKATEYLSRIHISNALFWIVIVGIILLFIVSTILISLFLA